MVIESALIVDAVRTPMGRGKLGGRLASVPPVELLTQLFQALFERNEVDPARVDDVIVGCVSQVGEQSSTPGRWAWLGAGLPEHVPSTTVERKCGSSQQALHFGAQGIMAGAYDIVVVAGVESMSRVPMGSARIDRDPFNGWARGRYAPGLVPQGISAELVAVRSGLKRLELDEYSVRSHRLAAITQQRGGFEREIVPIRLSGEGADDDIDVDETIRADSSVEILSGLKPAFFDEQYADRFPEIEWMITAGNSSQITDGAAALLMTSESVASQFGLDPRARVVGFGLAGDDPIEMLSAPIPATEDVLRKTGLSIDAFVTYEVNEAFASVPLAWQRHFGADPDRLNPRGGAIALGHPLGASGARVTTSLLAELEERGGGLGLQVMCEAGGMANATVIEGLGSRSS